MRSEGHAPAADTDTGGVPGGGCADDAADACVRAVLQVPNARRSQHQRRARLHIHLQITKPPSMKKAPANKHWRPVMPSKGTTAATPLTANKKSNKARPLNTAHATQLSSSVSSSTSSVRAAGGSVCGAMGTGGLTDEICNSAPEVSADGVLCIGPDLMGNSFCACSA